MFWCSLVGADRPPKQAMPVGRQEYLGCVCLKKNQSTPRPSEHSPVMGEKMTKRLSGIKGCK